MRIKILFLWVMCLFTWNAWAQEDTLRTMRDSIRINQMATNDALTVPFQVDADKQVDTSLSASHPSEVSIQIEKPSLLIPYSTNPSPLFIGDYNTGGMMFIHRYGALMGAGSQTSIPGIGRSNDASLTYLHSFSPQWVLSVGVNANKLHMSHYTGQAFGASGTLSYRAADRLTFNVFGGYNSGYMSGRQSYHYGGSVAFDMTNRWGMEMGVQRYYNPLRGGWETVPIATPYYKFKNGSKMGLDVGGLLYQIFRGASFKSSVNGGARPNPTIRPQGPRIEIR